MRFENIVRNLKKDGYEVEVMEFSFQNCFGVRGTALIDLVNGEIKDTTAKYKEVVAQIETNKSHILTVEGKKKFLTEYTKLIK